MRLLTANNTVVYELIGKKKPGITYFLASFKSKEPLTLQELDENDNILAEYAPSIFNGAFGPGAILTKT